MPLNGNEVPKNKVMVSCVLTGTANYATFTTIAQHDPITTFVDGDRFVYSAWAVDTYGNPTGTDWEVGIGVVGTSGTVITRSNAEILGGSNGTSRVSWPASSLVRISNIHPAQRAVFPVVSIYTSNGTHNFNSATKAFAASGVGGGGGGGGGRKGAAGSNRFGGSGGGAGGATPLDLQPIAGLTSLAVVVGTGGTGGAGTAVTADGGPGIAGGNTTLGSILFVPGGSAGRAGTGSPNTDAPATTGATYNGGFGSLSSSSSSAGGSGTGPGGGGGGTVINTANVDSVAWAGGTRSTLYDGAGAGAAGTSGSRAGGNGGSVTTGMSIGGAGGGGGYSSQTPGTNAGAGGNGGNYGGGGGGGGASLAGVTIDSGAGGNGGPGILVVIEFG